METIVSAAWQDPRTGLISVGPAHANCYPKDLNLLIMEVGIGIIQANQGYMTSKGRFVGREEAAVIAQSSQELPSYWRYHQQEEEMLNERGWELGIRLT